MAIARRERTPPGGNLTIMSVSPLPPQGLDALRARHLARRRELAEVVVTAVDNETDEEIRGSIVPRIFTPPLVELTPETSYGYALIEFADMIGIPLDPWQQWLAIHLGELLPDGRPRFRLPLILVARQNGKTTFARILTLYWMLIEQVALVVGTSSSRETAKETWSKLIEWALGIEATRHRFGPKAERKTIGEEAFVSRGCSRGCEIEHDHTQASTYKFAAPTRRAGRSKTVDRALLDELREHQDWDVWDALINAMQAVPDAQAVAITNQGDILSVVLDDLR